jgi:tRNA dimethylallyltransferase
VRRVIRALEIAGRSGTVPVMRKVAPPWRVLLIGLTAERKALYARIDARVDGMIDQGLVDEVKKLLDTGYSCQLPSMSGIGYTSMCLHLEGELTLDAAVRQIKTETHRLVRRQYNWFRLTDERIRWFDIEDGGAEAKIEAAVTEFLSV